MGNLWDMTHISLKTGCDEEKKVFKLVCSLKQAHILGTSLSLLLKADKTTDFSYIFETNSFSEI